MSGAAVLALGRAAGEREDGEGAANTTRPPLKVVVSSRVGNAAFQRWKKKQNKGRTTTKTGTYTSAFTVSGRNVAADDIDK